MSFKDALDSIGNGIENLAELNVMTYTGTVNANVAGETAKDVITAARNTGNLNMVGVTTIKMDGDIEQFISNDDNIDEKLHSAHVSAVQAGQRSRQATVDLFKTAIQNTMKNLVGNTD